MKTLTEMLKEINPDDVELYKEAFKKWLRTVSLGAELDSNNDVWRARDNLVTLVDEP